jgi:hypothetical protein
VPEGIYCISRHASKAEPIISISERDRWQQRTRYNRRRRETVSAVDHCGCDGRSPAFGERVPIPSGSTGISARAPLPLYAAQNRGLPTAKDHIKPLACGGPDAVWNMQWQTVAEAKAKGPLGNQDLRPIASARGAG